MITNPLCACGCGREVSRPWNKWILGHSSPRKLSPRDVRIAKLMLQYKIPQARIATELGVTQAVICSVNFGMLDERLSELAGIRFVPNEARKDIWRIEDERRHKAFLEDKRWFRLARRTMKEINRLVRQKG